jgi:hypothetical protein
MISDSVIAQSTSNAVFTVVGSLGYCGSTTLTLYIVVGLATVPCLIWLAGFVMTWAE